MAITNKTKSCYWPDFPFYVDYPGVLDNSEGHLNCFESHDKMFVLTLLLLSFCDPGCVYLLLFSVILIYAVFARALGVNLKSFLEKGRV